MSVSIIPIERAQSMGVQVPQGLFNAFPQQNEQVEPNMGGWGTSMSGYTSTPRSNISFDREGSQGSMSGDGYADYLYELARINQKNPTFQKQMLEMYLNEINPENQMKRMLAEQESQYALEQAQREQDLKVLSLLDTTDPKSEIIADDILSRLGYASQPEAPVDANGYLSDWRDRQLKNMQSAITLSDYNRYQSMYNFTPEQVSAYEAPVTPRDRWANYVSNAQTGNPFDALPGFFSGDQIRNQRVGLGGY